MGVGAEVWHQCQAVLGGGQRNGERCLSCGYLVRDHFGSPILVCGVHWDCRLAGVEWVALEPWELTQLQCWEVAEIYLRGSKELGEKVKVIIGRCLEAQILAARYHAVSEVMAREADGGVR